MTILDSSILSLLLRLWRSSVPVYVTRPTRQFFHPIPNASSICTGKTEPFREIFPERVCQILYSTHQISRQKETKTQACVVVEPSKQPTKQKQYNKKVQSPHEPLLLKKDDEEDGSTIENVQPARCGMRILSDTPSILWCRFRGKLVTGDIYQVCLGGMILEFLNLHAPLRACQIFPAVFPSWPAGGCQWRTQTVSLLAREVRQRG